LLREVFVTHGRENVTGNPLFQSPWLGEVEGGENVLEEIGPGPVLAPQGIDDPIRYVQKVLVVGSVVAVGTDRHGIDQRENLTKLFRHLIVATELASQTPGDLSTPSGSHLLAKDFPFADRTLNRCFRKKR
jgi:hypothetical protein